MKKIRIIAKGGGRKSEISPKEGICLCLVYLRQKPIFEILGLLFDISKTKANDAFNYWVDILRDILPASQIEEVSADTQKYQELQRMLSEYELIVDSAEQATARLIDYQEQKIYYSGNKKMHTLKNQFIILPVGEDIVDICVGILGKTSDINLFRDTRNKFACTQKFLGDKAYMGDDAITTPHKKRKNTEISELQKQKNKQLSSRRIAVEHMICLVKICRVASDRFRLARHRYSQVIMAVCGLVRLRLNRLVSLTTLSIICERSPGEIFPDLAAAVQFGLILPASELNEQLLIQNYKFLHDRVQQAAYALIDENQKQLVHLQIGRNLLQKTSTETLSNKLFEIVEHFNGGVELVTDQLERDEIARLNLMAGQKAKAAIAHDAAKRYVTTGIELLTDDSWQRQYDLSLALYEEATQIAYLCGHFDVMEKWATVVLQEARTILDKVKVYEIKIQTYMAQTKLLDAVKIGLQVLKLLGVNLPESPTPLDIQQQLKATMVSLAQKNREDLIHLPIMTDACRLAAMRILSSIISPSYQAASTLLPLITCEQVNLTIKYGNAPFSAFAYAMYGLILNGVVNDSEAADQFGNLALSLMEQLKAEELKSKTLLTVAGNILHGKYHLIKTLPLLQKGYHSGIENGDFEFAGLAACIKGQYSYFSGLELTQLEREMANYRNILAQLKQETALNYHQICHQAVLNLLGKAENPSRLFGTVYNEEQLLPLHLAANDRAGLNFFYIHKLILCYLFGSPQALENAAAAELYLDGVTGLLQVPLFYFYDSLVRLSVCSSVPDTELTQLLLKITSNQEKLGKLLIEASGEVEQGNVRVLQSIPIDSGNVCVAIANYVARTKESVVLNDATHEGKFTNDPYIQAHQPKSILCAPLIYQGKLVSIVYLENNLPNAGKRK